MPFEESWEKRRTCFSASPMKWPPSPRNPKVKDSNWKSPDQKPAPLLDAWYHATGPKLPYTAHNRTYTSGDAGCGKLTCSAITRSGFSRCKISRSAFHWLNPAADFGTIGVIVRTKLITQCRLFRFDLKECDIANKGSQQNKIDRIAKPDEPSGK